MERLDWDGGSVSIAWDRPKDDPRAVIVLGHGAGGYYKEGIHASIAPLLAADGFAVLRFNFPYRESGRGGPGAQTVSEACYRAMAEHARADGLRLFCGGVSYGGRMATHIVADGVAVDGLVLISYPLHAPGRTDKLRDEHLREIDVPMLFVHGTRDAFARKDLMDELIASLPTATYVAIDGGDHSLNVRGTSRPEVYDLVAREVARFVSGLSS